jgi:4a-hydroxytetrahydrobiopterin dehydratase
VNDWLETENSLEKTFEFPDFKSALEWMNKASVKIEEMDHHPEWTNVYNRVIVKLSTHSAGNIVTDKDRKLAEILDALR